MGTRSAFPLEAVARWDTALCLRCNRMSRRQAVRGVFRAVSRLGDGIFWYALMLFLLAHDRWAAVPAVLHLLLTGAAGTLFYRWAKTRTLRLRPFEAHPDIVAAGRALDRFSFPSGHTLHAVAFTIVTLHYYPALAPLLVPFALLVALSRPVLGLHYPSDVLAGGAIGAVLAGASLML